MTDSPTVEELRTAALAYAERGWRVFPVRVGRKDPATAHGWQDATTDRYQIEAWWAAIPYLIGLHCGPESGVFVVDVDTHDGPANWLPPGPTLTSATGGRYFDAAGADREPGRHYFYRWPAGVAKMRAQLKPRVDIQGAGKYVILPPSVTDAAYVWVDESPIADAPPALLAEVAVAVGATANADDDVRPGDRFNAGREWNEEWFTSHGWAIDHGPDAAGLTYWTRPGKNEGTSATTGMRDSGGGSGVPADLLYVFTSSTGFEAGRAYSKFGAYAVLEHGGDLSSAAKALVEPALAPRLFSSGGVAQSVEQSSPQVASAILAPSAPSTYTFDPALPAGHLIADYIAYAAQMTDAPLEYHEAAVLTVLATMTANVRMLLAPFPNGMHTNLYIVLAGPSSRARKSTAQALAVSFLHPALRSKVLPDRMTGEAGIGALAELSGGPALWLPDEMGAAIREIYSREFLKPLEQLFLTLYGSRSYEYRTVLKEVSVSGIHLSILGAATPESFGGAGRAFASGLLPRLGVVFPSVLPAARPPRALDERMADARAALETRFRAVMIAVNRPEHNKIVTLSAAGGDVLAQVDAALGQETMTARLATAAYKVAALVAVADGRWEVTAEDAAAAAKVVQRWAGGMQRLRPYAVLSERDFVFQEMLNDIRRILREAPGEQNGLGRKAVSRATVAKLAKLEHATLNRVRNSLLDTQEIQKQEEGGEELWLFRG